MKKPKAWIVVLIAAVLVATGVLAAVHLLSSPPADGSAVVLRSGAKSVAVGLDRLDRTAFQGVLTNGKGESAAHAFRGIELRTVLAQEGFELSDGQTVVATAQDSYSATLTAAEVRTPGKVYLAVSEDGSPLPGLAEGSKGALLVVFGDPNAKRDVRMLATIEVTGG